MFFNSFVLIRCGEQFGVSDLKRPVTVWLKPTLIKRVDRLRGDLSRSRYIGIALDSFLGWRDEGGEEHGKKP